MITLLRVKIKLRRNLSWVTGAIHRNILSNPVCKWAANIAGWGLLVAGIGLAQWDEYVLALVLFIGGSVMLFLKAYHWQTDQTILKALFVIVASCGILVSLPVTIAKKGNKPWSDTISKWTFVASLSPSDLKRAIIFALPRPPETSIETPRIAPPPTTKPDLVPLIVNPDKPALLVFPLHSIANNVSVYLILWDIDREDGRIDSLLTKGSKYDWLRPDQMGGPTPLVQTNDLGNIVKTGDRIFGYAVLECPDCLHVRMYWIYLAYGESGRYAMALVGKFPDPGRIAGSIPQLRHIQGDWFLSTIKGVRWKPIQPMP